MITIIFSIDKKQKKMNAREFFFLTANMRDAQKRYFKDRDPIVFRAARKLEIEVDREIARVKEILSQLPTE